jgi:acetylornithine deacetylase
MMSDTSLEAARDTLARLVAFDTTSRNSNLALIDWTEALLRAHGARTARVPNAEGTKTNLVASLGPDVAGGVVLSGHTDVVPIDGQVWASDPWTLSERDGRLYGRGTCDMKGFIALAALPRVSAGPLARPLHFALSYDEEVGCIGAPAMVDLIADTFPAPQAVIVGEPSDMKVISGHKGISTFRVIVDGREAHSSQIHQGVSAIMRAIPLLQEVDAMAREARAAAPAHSPFDPPGTTITIGMLNGGTAVNILAKRCEFVFDVRHEAGDDPQRYRARIEALAARIDAEIKAIAPEGGARVEPRSGSPGMGPEPDGAAERLCRQLTGDNQVRAVSYAAEGGLFQRRGLSTVICGPGSILQAHQPDEFIEISQLAEGVRFIDRLIDTLRA